MTNSAASKVTRARWDEMFGTYSLKGLGCSSGCGTVFCCPDRDVDFFALSAAASILFLYTGLSSVEVLTRGLL